MAFCGMWMLVKSEGYCVFPSAFSHYNEWLQAATMCSDISAFCEYRNSPTSQKIYRCNDQLHVNRQIGSEARIGEGISASKDRSLSPFFVTLLFICAFSFVQMQRRCYTGSEIRMDMD